MTQNHFSVRLCVQPVIQTLTNSSVPKSDMFGHTVIETDNFNATSLPLSLSGVMSMILVVLSMIIMLWLYIWIYIASNLNQVPTHYGHVIMCQKKFPGFELQKWNIVDVNKFTTFFKKSSLCVFVYMPH